MAPDIKWRGSKARAILLNDLEHGVLSLDENVCTADEAWENYKSMIDFIHVPESQFKRQLAAHREQLKRFNWKNSEARRILIEDLQSGFLSLDEAKVPAKEAWEKHYKGLFEFKDVLFSQFEDRLADHREQVEKDHHASIKNEIAYLNSRTVYPRSPLNRNGEPVFDMSPAKDLLRQDIKAGLGKTMTPEEIRSRHSEYGVFEKSVFHNHVRQEIKRQKRLNSKSKKKK